MYFQSSPEVQQAIADKQPVVALESTIISHGMPFPQNVEMAFQVEKMVRSTGAIPATCAIIEGKMTAGLSADQIEMLGKKGFETPKASRRDFPFLLAKKMNGATTVAATMIVAKHAGIRFFATGGIGGVHRGASQSFDISADLQELAKTNVAVVSAGVKSILDIGLTLEYLETLGVPVIGYQTDDFPAFYNRKSGFGVDVNAQSPKDIAEMMRAKWAIGLEGGAIIANPVPKVDELPKSVMDQAIEQALTEADTQGIKGKDITPFLLAKIKALTAGESLVSNISLVLNNARLAGEIAVAYWV